MMTEYPLSECRHIVHDLIFLEKRENSVDGHVIHCESSGDFVRIEGLSGMFTQEFIDLFSGFCIAHSDEE